MRILTTQVLVLGAPVVFVLGYHSLTVVFQAQQNNTTAGLERSGAIVPYYCYDAVGALVVYGIMSRASYRSVTRWLKSLRNHGQLKIVIILVGNKTDLKDDRMVRAEEAKACVLRY
ncbi:ras family-domain-containing protein [Suillus placidus]|uniref:Ras family-domain-containing protein n=1 Tax=Suillus placidus TaxID=48579 RepID=A0A9P6ZXV7_9AGAM|nr:ras family-domain-containing protein [Suillus placidus]